MRESLSLAMEVQQNLLPSEESSIKNLDIAGHSTYCDETGGDYYDFLDVSGADEDTAVIALGDDRPRHSTQPLFRTGVTGRLP